MSFSTPLNVTNFLIRSGFVLGHHRIRSTSYLAAYYLGFSRANDCIIFSTTAVVRALYLVKNFFSELFDYFIKKIFRKQDEFLNFIFVLAELDHTALFVHLFISIFQQRAARFFSFENRTLHFACFRFYFLYRPIPGFLNNAKSLFHHSSIYLVRTKNPESFQYGKSVFFAFGSTNLKKTVKEVRSHMGNIIFAIVDSNQHRVLDNADYALFGNDDSFHFFSFVITYLLKVLYKRWFTSLVLLGM